MLVVGDARFDETAKLAIDVVESGNATLDEGFRTFGQGPFGRA